MVLVTSSDASESIEAIPYSTLSSDMRKAVRELKKKLNPGDDAEDDPLSFLDDEPDLLAESQDWTNSDGATITAGVQSVTESEIVFVMADGSEVPYPLGKLSDASREKAVALGKTEQN